MSPTLTTRQQHRRDTAIAAVVDLVADRGVDDLQMRDVSERSGVALATLYRYFASKDHLVAIALMAWASGLDERVGPPLERVSPAERLTQVLRQGVSPFERQPHFARMLLYVSTSLEPAASEIYLRLGTIVRTALGRAIPDVDPEAREGTLQVIGSVWYHSIVEWVSGRITIEEVHARLERASTLLLGDRSRTVTA